MTWTEHCKHAGRCCNYTLAFVLFSLLCLSAARIYVAFHSGRVAQVLHNIVEHTNQEGR